MGPNILIGIVLISILILVLIPWDKIKQAGKKRAEEETVPVAKLNNLAEAQVLKGLLEENGIVCLVNSFEDYAYDGIWQTQKGWGVLRVLEKDRVEAERLVVSFVEANKNKDNLIPDSPTVPSR